MEINYNLLPFARNIKRSFSTVMGLIGRSIFSKPTWLSVGFTIFLLVLEYNLFYIDYRTYVEILLDETGAIWQMFLRLGAHVIVVAIPAVLFIRFSLTARGPVKLAYFTIFSLIIVTQYGYARTLNHFMALHDLETALNSYENWADAIINYVNPAAVVPVAVYAVLLLMVNNPGKPQGFASLGGALLLIFGINSAIFFYTEFNAVESRLRVLATGPAVSVEAFFRMVTSASLEQTFSYRGARQTVAFQAADPPQNNIVLIVDESVRYDHLSLNGYHRPTTPYLESLAAGGQLANWGEGVSGTTCSYQSVALLLTGVTELPDTRYQIKQWPTIFQYAKAMGYQTVYFDGESNAPRPPLTSNDFAYVDAWFNQNQFGDHVDTDLQIAEQTAARLKDSVGNFIVIFKRGVHTPYNKNYPAHAAVWTPVLPGHQILSDNREELVNSYDNSLKYNLDPFFQALLAAPEVLEYSVILYTSDHGQTLSENGEQRTHCGDTPNEAAVPVFMITDQRLPVDVRYRASHRNLFATVLDLMRFPEDRRHYPYTLSLLSATVADSTTRYFYQGPLYGFDQSRWIPYD